VCILGHTAHTPTHTESLFLLWRHLGNWPRSKHEKQTAGSMRNLDSCRCWRCTLCLCKVRNKFLVNFWNRTILLCIPCIFTPWVHKFSINLGSIPKFWVPERRCEASSALNTHKHNAPPYKTFYPGNLAPNICASLTSAASYIALKSITYHFHPYHNNFSSQDQISIMGNLQVHGLPVWRCQTPSHEQTRPQSISYSY